MAGGVHAWQLRVARVGGVLALATVGFACYGSADEQSTGGPSGTPPDPQASSPSAANPSKGPPGSGFYDVAPLLTSLRPSAQSGVAQAAGVASLDELPLYDLDLAVDLAGSSFTLREQVFFTNREQVPMDEVVLRVYASSPQGGASVAGGPLVKLESGSCDGAKCVVSAQGPSTISVRPDRPLAPGDRLQVRLDLRGRLQEIDSSRTNLLMQSLESISLLGGGESSSFGLLAKGDGIATMANFYAVVARRRAGAWERSDDSVMGDLGSDDMSHVRATIDVGERARVVTTGVTTKEAVVGGRRVVHVNAGMVRDFAVVASEALESASVRVGEVEVRSHFLPAERRAGEKALDVARFALEDFEKHFGPYPYADLDIVEAPLIGGAGGVEFAGLVTIASMLYRPAFPTDGPLGGLLSMLGQQARQGGPDPMTELTDRMLEFTTAHEVAHQYWHGLVGSDSRRHPYLDESLAQFSAITYLGDRYGKDRAKQDGELNVAMNYRSMRMLGRPDARADRSVAEFGDLLSYAGLVYGKAPYLWIAIRDELGEASFFRGVRRYVDDNRLRLAKPGALIEALAAADPAKASRVRALAKRWLEEPHGDEDIGPGSLLDVLGPALGLDPGAIDPKMVKLLDLLVRRLANGDAGDPTLEELAPLLELLLDGSI